MDVQAEIKKVEVRDAGIPAVIHYEGDNQTFVWKHPMTDFVTGSQLIVHESQEAIFLRNGEALDSFGRAATRWKPASCRRWIACTRFRYRDSPSTRRCISST